MNRAMFLVLARSLGAEDARILKNGQLSLEVEIIVKDASSLAYLNWTVWLIEVLLDVTQGVVIDPAAQCCRGRVEWEKCTGPFDVSRHVALHVTEWEHDTRWVHSHGMEKFAQPDLEIVQVPLSLVREAMLLVNQFAGSLARGARLQAGQTINIGPIGDAQVIQSTSGPDHQEPFGRLRFTDMPSAAHASVSHANSLLGAGAYLEGCQLAEAGQLAQALEAFDRVLAADPKAEAALGAKASTLLVAERPQEALAVAWELKLHNPDNPDAYYLAGQALMALGQYETAADAFTQGIEQSPHDAALFEATLYQERARCYLALNRQQEAGADQAYAARLVAQAR
jgi:tetratricopeptide (TPR) repeat protein